MVHRDVKFDEEKAMICSLEREIQLHADAEILAPKEERQDDLEKPRAKEQRVEAPTHEDTSRDGRKCIIEDDILMHDSRENVGAPTSQHR